MATPAELKAQIDQLGKDPATGGIPYTAVDTKSLLEALYTLTAEICDRLDQINTTLKTK